MANTPNLDLTFIDAAQSQKHITMNEALIDLDTMVQATALDKDLAAPPGSPSEGDTYIVAVGGTGAWAGKDNNLTTYYNGGWRFYVPKVGRSTFVVDEGLQYLFLTSWIALPDLVALEARVTALENP